MHEKALAKMELLPTRRAKTILVRLDREEPHKRARGLDCAYLGTQQLTKRRSEMPTLHIDFQEGFLDDAVVVRVNNEEYRKQDIRTRLQTGYAGSLEFEVRESMVDVEVVLPSRGSSKSIPVVFGKSDTVYLGLSITAQGEISERVSHEPFGYL